MPGHSHLISAAETDPDMDAIVLTTEEEGVALAAGAWLGGQRAALLMQSSGVGNTINMLSLPATCRMPFFTLITMRGEWAEFNPWQVPMGSATPAVLAAMGVHVRRADHAEDVAEIVAASAALAFDSAISVAVLFSQRPDRRQGVREMNNQLDRRAVVAELLRDPSDVLVIAGLGAAAYDLAAAGDRPLNFYLWGAMGGAAMIGLGLARAQPNRRVLVITGDGEMLMGMGALATITAAGATNLAIAVLDNGQYRRNRRPGEPHPARRRPCRHRRRLRLDRDARHDHGGGEGAQAASAAGKAVRFDRHFARGKAAVSPTQGRRLAHHPLPRCPRSAGIRPGRPSVLPLKFAA